MRDLVGKIVSKGGVFNADPNHPMPVGVEIKVMVGTPTGSAPLPSNAPPRGLGGLGGFFRGLSPRGNNDRDENFPSERKSSPAVPHGGDGGSISKDQILLSLFEPLVLQPPSDHALKLQWDGLIDRQIRSKIFKINAKLVSEEISRCALATKASNLHRLETALGGRLLSKGEVKKAIETAVTLQAAREVISVNAEEVGERKVSPVGLSLWALETGLGTVDAIFVFFFLLFFSSSLSPSFSSHKVFFFYVCVPPNDLLLPQARFFLPLFQDLDVQSHAAGRK